MNDPLRAARGIKNGLLIAALLWLVAILSIIGLRHIVAHAATTPPLVIGHRGASTATIPESTQMAYDYAINNGAAMVEADIQWTKDGADADTVGTMIVLHDATLDRTTNCTGYTTAMLWVDMRDDCRTDIAHQPILKLTDLITFANEVDTPILFHMKVAMNTAQAKQFWKAAKLAPAGSLLAGSKSRVPGILKVKTYDAADSLHKLRYGYETAGEPSVATIKNVGPTVVADKSLSSSRVAYYRSNSITVYLQAATTETDYAAMTVKKPNGLLINDIRRYNQWLVNR
jgi:Glycerophosphoryl diester phosphodiesterase family